MKPTLPSRKMGFLREDLGDEVLLCDTGARVIHVLNSTAQVIWEHCDGQHSLQDVEHALRSRFAVQTGHDLYTDIKRTLKAFAEKGLLE